LFIQESSLVVYWFISLLVYWCVRYL